MYLEKTSLWSNRSIDLFILESNDVSPEYVFWLNNSSINCYLESRFSHHTIEPTKEFVQKCLLDSKTLFMGIRYLELGGKHIGNVKLSPVDQNHRTAEVGILIGETEVWGKGIASKVISMIIDIAEMQLGLRKLTAGCYASNVGSKKAFLKAGFYIEGRRKNQVLLNGKPEDVLLMAYFMD